MGDLITLLLNSDIIDASVLVPVEHYNPIITHRSVNSFAAGEIIGSANHDYAGGFAGAMANSYAVDASVKGAVNVSATGCEELLDGKRSIKALAGGFTGAAMVG